MIGTAGTPWAKLKLAIVIPAVGVALVVTACGSSAKAGGSTSSGGSSAASTGAAASASSDSGSSGDELKIGVMTPMTGALAATGKAVVNGMNARINEVNAKGGIQGHKVKLVVGDDQLDPTKAPGVARTLIESDGVLTMNTSGSASASATLPYLQANKVVNIPTNGSTALIAKPDSTYRLFVPAYDVLAPAVVDYAVKTLHKSRIAVAYTPDAVGLPTLAGTKAELAKLGLPLVASVSFSSTATSAAAQAAQLKAANADFVVVIHTPAVASVIIKANEQIGFKPAYGSAYPLANPALPNLMGTALDGRIFFATPFNSPDAATSTDYKASMTALGADPNDTNAVNGYTDADVQIALLTKAVAAAGGKVPTRDQVLAATNGFSLNDNYVKNLTWTATDFTGMKAAQIIGLKDSKFVDVAPFASVG